MDLDEMFGMFGDMGQPDCVQTMNQGVRYFALGHALAAIKHGDCVDELVSKVQSQWSIKWSESSAIVAQAKRMVA